MDWKSDDWQSLTFIGERHRIRLRITGDNGAEIARRLTGGIGDAEFAIPGHVVADILVADPPTADRDGAILLNLEALTIEE